MYYVSTNIKDCEDYEKAVTEGEGFKDENPLYHWSIIVKKYNEDLWAVHAHPNYPSDMETVENVFHFSEPFEL